MPYRSHGWAYRSVRPSRMWQATPQLQQLQKSPLPQVPGAQKRGMDTVARGRAVKCPLFPCGLHIARCIECAVPASTGKALPDVVEHSLENAERFWNQSGIPGSPHRHDSRPAHLGTEPQPTPTPALHCPRRRSAYFTKMEEGQKQGQVPLSGQGHGQGVQGQISRGFEHRRDTR